MPQRARCRRCHSESYMLSGKLSLHPKKICNAAVMHLVKVLYINGLPYERLS